MSEITNWSHHNPVRVKCDRIETLSDCVSVDHVLVVTTPGFVRRGIVQRIKDILTPRQVTIWSGVKPNPDMHDLDAATVDLRPSSVACVVGIGGGSALDAAKVLANTIPSSSGISLVRAFRDKEPIQFAPRLPLIAVPTTSGTGAEVTPFATLWDHESCQKYSLTGDFVYPDVALLDPHLTITLGHEDTLYPALDTISHALESLWNKNCNPVSRALAYQSLALSSEALPVVLKQHKDIKVRQDLQVASVLAGLAISQTRTAIAHSISYPLTSHFGVPHGLACSFTLNKILEGNIEQIARDSFELCILKKIAVVLDALNLKEHMERFVSCYQVESVMKAMMLSERSGNFKGVINLNKVVNESINHAK